MVCLKVLCMELKCMVYECSGGWIVDCWVLEVLWDYFECLIEYDEIGV